MNLRTDDDELGAVADGRYAPGEWRYVLGP
jgi:hypothetical protein